MRLKFCKKWFLLDLAPWAAFSIVGVSSCEAAATPSKEDLAALKSLLWSISPEHVAHELNVFKNATRQYDEVIKKNVDDQTQTWTVKHTGSEGHEIDDRLVKVAKKVSETQEKADEYSVTYWDGEQGQDYSSSGCWFSWNLHKYYDERYS